MIAAMGARHFRELDVWQMADALRCEVYRLASVERARRDFKFHGQLTDAVSNIPSNIAEGFARRSHADFARFIDYARSGIAEVDERLHDGVLREHWRKEDLMLAANLIERLPKALDSLWRYLHGTDRPPY